METSVTGRRFYWPKDLPRQLAVPETTIHDMLEVSRRRYASSTALHFFGTDIDYRRLHDEVERLAGWLTRRAGVRRGDRVLLYLQNSPQWVVAYYAVLRADAVVVAVNPMSRAAELAHYLSDSGARVAVCAQDLLPELGAASSGTDLSVIIGVVYRDYLLQSHDYTLPAWVLEPSRRCEGIVAWHDVLAAMEAPAASLATADDPSGIVYTSGSTGRAKGCLLTHRAYMHNIVGQALWHWVAPGTPVLGVAPMFHVSGLNHGVHLPVYVGGSSVVVPRWDREIVAALIERRRIGHASIPPTALVDLLGMPDLPGFDFGSLRRLTSGGAAMPDALANRVEETLGVTFIEAYGLTETAATTHLNPVVRPKRQSIGVPFFGTEALVIDPDGGAYAGAGESGEIVVRGPQLFSGYWNDPEATREAFIDIEGRRFLRTGDIGHVDDEGYFFLTDRAKRMINASGYKVWPAEVEKVLLQHPGVKEVCVIGVPDAYRGESVQAVVIRADGHALTERELAEWARARMSAYKCPRSVQFVNALPKSSVGKILWRVLQDEARRATPS